MHRLAIHVEGASPKTLGPYQCLAWECQLENELSGDEIHAHVCGTKVTCKVKYRTKTSLSLLSRKVEGVIVDFLEIYRIRSKLISQLPQRSLHSRYRIASFGDSSRVLVSILSSPRSCGEGSLRTQYSSIPLSTLAYSIPRLWVIWAQTPPLATQRPQDSRLGPRTVWSCHLQ